LQSFCIYHDTYYLQGMACVLTEQYTIVNLLAEPMHIAQHYNSYTVACVETEP
jgi:hypothetical protein